MSSRSPAAAFTLIELLVALSLSIGILLLAYTAFRTFARAFHRAQQLVAQNDLARRGIITAFEQVDGWNDYADPGYPYGKRYNALGNVRIDGRPAAGAPDDNPGNKAPFRPVAFSTAGNFNPNWMQPHDPRAWYRNHLMPGPRPPVVRRDNGWFYWPNAVYGGGSFSGNWNRKESDIPPGWEGRHVFGDYALVSNLAMDPTDADAEVAVAAARPRLVLDAWVELGMVGLLDYLPPGAIPLAQMPSTGLAAKQAAPRDWRQHAGLGELPWSLAHPQSLSSNRGKFWGGHQRVLMPGLNWNSFSNDGLTYPTDAGSHPAIVTATSPGIRLATFHRANLADFFDATGLRGIHAVDLATVLGNNLLFRPNFIGRDYNGNWDTGPWRMGVRSGLHQLTWGIGRMNENIPAINGVGLYDYGNTLYLNPAWPANAPTPPDPGSRLPGTPLATLTSVRYRFRGGEYCNAVLRLADPETGDVLCFGIYALGTSLRGARQHWALVSDDPATPAFDPRIGDLYR